MERELTRERDEDAARAERVVEVEERLKEAREDASGDPDREVKVDLRPTDKISAPVVGVRKMLNSCRFTCLVDGEEVTVSVPWPADTDDSTEPLVRLCRANDVPIDRVGDIDSVTLVDTDRRGYGIYVPPGKQTTEFTVVLPSGRELSYRRTPLRSHVEAGVARLSLALTNTPLVDLDAGYRGFSVNGSAVLWAYTGLCVLTSAVLLAVNTPLATLLASPGGTFLALVVLSMMVAAPLGLVVFFLFLFVELNDATVEA